MKKRDIISEILSKRKRLSNRNDVYEHADKRLTSLIYTYFHLQPLSREHKNIKSELIRYFAVGFVSCLEGYYRAIIKELIDHGPPFRDNAPRLDELKLDIRTLTQLHDKKVSIGEMISHLLKISSFDDIQKHMSTLLGCDYFSKLKTKTVVGNKVYGEFHPRAYATLNDIFADRHVACHELNPRLKWTFKRAVEQWRVASHTIEANEGILKDYRLRNMLKETANKANSADAKGRATD